jgi:hypothetical protein
LVTCVPAEPKAYGGSKAEVRLANADVTAMKYNLLEDYGCFAKLETAREAFCSHTLANSLELLVVWPARSCAVRSPPSSTLRR